jgi:hypothetical protein
MMVQTANPIGGITTHVFDANSAWLGLSRADSVPNLTRRLEARLKTAPLLSDDLAEILRRATEPGDGTGTADDRGTEVSRGSGRMKTKNKA